MQSYPKKKKTAMTKPLMCFRQIALRACKNEVTSSGGGGAVVVTPVHTGVELRKQSFRAGDRQVSVKATS